MGVEGVVGLMEADWEKVGDVEAGIGWEDEEEAAPAATQGTNEEDGGEGGFGMLMVGKLRDEKEVGLEERLEKKSAFQGRWSAARKQSAEQQQRRNHS